jgi:hypothetical protein
MNSDQHRRLHEWIAEGQSNGTIQDIQTVVLAYCMDEREVLAWIADVVTGKTDEQDAIVSMERALAHDDAPSSQLAG